MTDRALGVEDKAAAPPGIKEYRTRQWTVNSLTVCEQYLIRRRERVESSLTLYSVSMLVTAAANSATTWRWLLRNPTGSGKTVALRDLSVTTQLVSNALAVPSGPRFTLERWTATGTATGGTVVTPARTISGQTPAAILYTAAPTGVTAAVVATAFAFFPACLLTATVSEAVQPAYQDYHTTDPSIELAAGEALAFRQADAGTATEATHRNVLTNVLIEEFSRP